MFIIKLYSHFMCLIKKILYRCIYRNRITFGKNVQFRKGFSLMIDKNARVIIEDGVFFNNYCSINALKKIIIGKNCIIGENVKFYDHNHIFNKKNKLIKEQGFSCEEIIVG